MAGFFVAAEAGPAFLAKQGDILRIPIQVASDADFVSGSFLDLPVPLIQERTPSRWTAWIGIDLAAEAGTYPLTLEWQREGKKQTRRYPVQILSAAFGTQVLNLPDKMVHMDAQTLKRIAAEKAEMDAIWHRGQTAPLWTGDFVVPVKGEMGGTFGRRRIINGEPRQPHTGEDIAAPLGTPVVATNSGHVILVGDYYFNGRFVVIDHGAGLLSMYMHLLDIAVRLGDPVRRGERVGHVGQSGRASGPHLHWGMRLDNARVNPFSLLLESAPTVVLKPVPSEVLTP